MNQSPHSHFANNAAIHREIRTMLASFAEPSRSRMRAKIRHDRAAIRDHGTDQADAAARHTYHEFVLGLHLQRRGLRPEYNRKIDGKTPDWFDERRRLVLEVFTCERGGTTALLPRVAARIAEKASKYAQTVREHALCFVVAVHGDVLSGLNAEGCGQAIEDSNLFTSHPDLSGVVFFAVDGDARSDQRYKYTYFVNQTATRKINLIL